MLHLLPAELVHIILTYLTRVDRMSLGRVSRRYDNFYRQSLTSQAREVLNKMSHYLIGVSLSEMIEHLAYAHITITRSVEQCKREIQDVARAVDDSCAFRLRRTTTIKNLNDVFYEVKRSRDVMAIVRAIDPDSSCYAWLEIIPLRFYLDDDCRVLILDVFGNFYLKGKLLLSYVKEVVNHPRIFALFAFDHKMYKLDNKEIKEVECEQPYVHITMGGAITDRGQFYRVLPCFGQRPSLDNSTKFIVQACAYLDFLDHKWCPGYLIQHRKFYLDDQGILYEFKLRTYNGPNGLHTEEHVVSSNVQKFAVSASYYHLLLVVLQQDGSVFIDRYVYDGKLALFMERKHLSYQGVDLIDDGRHVHIVTSDRLVTITYTNNKITLQEEKKSICPPLDRWYQTYRCELSQIIEDADVSDDSDADNCVTSL